MEDSTANADAEDQHNTLHAFLQLLLELYHTASHRKCLCVGFSGFPSFPSQPEAWERGMPVS